MADTPNGETVTPGDSQTTVQTPVTPAPATEPVQSNAGDTAEVERLRKVQEQKDIRIRQLENEAEARKKADDEAEAKTLEENNQFKDLFEQEKTKREALEAEQTEAQRTAELNKVKDETLSEFSDDVKTLADEVGLSLDDADEASVAKYKEKLEKLSARVSDETKITPNNPNQPESKIDLSPEQLRETMHDDKDGTAFHEIVMQKFPGIAAMTKQK